MLSIISQLAGFAISVSLMAWAVRRIYSFTGSRTKAILCSVAVGIIVSVILDFTFSYATPGWERDAESVIERAIASIFFSVILSFIFTMKRFRHE